MKYEDSKVRGISKKTLRALEQIAMRADITLDQRGGIDCRNSDREDFPEISIYAIQAMLEQAYLLGRKDAANRE